MHSWNSTKEETSFNDLRCGRSADVIFVFHDLDSPYSNVMEMGEEDDDLDAATPPIEP